MRMQKELIVFLFKWTSWNYV